MFLYIIYIIIVIAHLFNVDKNRFHIIETKKRLLKSAKKEKKSSVCIKA